MPSSIPAKHHGNHYTTIFFFVIQHSVLAEIISNEIICELFNNILSIIDSINKLQNPAGRAFPVAAAMARKQRGKYQTIQCEQKKNLFTVSHWHHLLFC